MKLKGVTIPEYKLIQSIISKYRRDYDFFCYGSRVSGNFEATSDLDLLVKGEVEMPAVVLEELRESFDNSKLPFIVNVIDYFGLDKKFYESIEKELVRV